MDRDPRWTSWSNLWWVRSPMWERELSLPCRMMSETKLRLSGNGRDVGGAVRICILISGVISRRSLRTPGRPSHNAVMYNREQRQSVLSLARSLALAPRSSVCLRRWFIRLDPREYVVSARPRARACTLAQRRREWCSVPRTAVFAEMCRADEYRSVLRSKIPALPLSHLCGSRLKLRFYSRRAENCGKPQIDCEDRERTVLTAIKM